MSPNDDARGQTQLLRQGRGTEAPLTGSEKLMRVPYENLAAEGMKALAGVYAYILRCGIEKQLVDLVYLRASQINGCAYCIDTHSHDLMTQNVPVQKLLLLPAWRETEAFSPRERAALAWAEAVTRVADTHVPDGEFAAADDELSAKELADLTIAIGLINAYNRIAISFRRQPIMRASGMTSQIADPLAEAS
jgi:AhpD family alkylhydroperoxidase